MTLTGCDDNSSLDEDDYVRLEVEPEKKTASTTAGIELNSVNLKNHNKENSNTKCADKAEIPSEVGAGLLFGVSGLVLGGPILAILGGVGAAYVASKDEGPVGDAARASGSFAVETGSKVGEAAKEANEKHDLTDKIKCAFACVWSKVQHFDKEHKATEKVKETMNNVGEKSVEFERKHHVMEKMLAGIKNGVDFLLNKVREATGGSWDRNSTKSDEDSVTDTTKKKRTL